MTHCRHYRTAAVSAAGAVTADRSVQPLPAPVAEAATVRFFRKPSPNCDNNSLIICQAISMRRACVSGRFATATDRMPFSSDAFRVAGSAISGRSTLTA